MSFILSFILSLGFYGKAKKIKIKNQKFQKGKMEVVAEIF